MKDNGTRLKLVLLGMISFTSSNESGGICEMLHHFTRPGLQSSYENHVELPQHGTVSSWLVGGFTSAFAIPLSSLSRLLPLTP